MTAGRAAPALPVPRGPLSTAVIGSLAGGGGALPDTDGVIAGADPLGDDLQLALYVCYELHYSSFAGVDDSWEWEPHLLGFRAELEHCFESHLPELTGRHPDVAPERVGDELFALAAADPSPSVAEHLEHDGTLEQMREFMVLRSPYQLKEADPHTWAIPRLRGNPKAALVEVQADEYGSGVPERMHYRLFAEAMDAVGLDSTYGAYLDRIPGVTLATVNLISMLGLHRRLRGALVGHLAMFEITSPGPNRRYGRALRRLGFDGAATEFFDEHVEADSVHENVAAYDLAQGLAVAEPALAPDVVFGARALLALEGLAGSRMLAAWDRGESALLAEDAGTLTPA